MAQVEITAALLEIVKLYNPVTWCRRFRALRAIRKGRVIAASGAYYDVNDKGEKIAGPWCTTCFDTKGERVRFISALQPPEHSGPSWAYVQCPICRNVFASRRIGEYLNTH